MSPQAPRSRSVWAAFLLVASFILVELHLEPRISLGKADFLRLRSLAGDQAAMFDLALALRDDTNRERRAEAVRLLFRSAEAGHVGAMRTVGEGLLSGHFRTGEWIAITRTSMGGPVYVRDARAIDFVRRAALGGDAEAMRIMGRLTALEQWIPGEGPDEGRQWYERAASCNDAESMYMLGVGHAQGWWGRVDLRRAEEWLARAYRWGFQNARHELARIRPE